MAPISFRPDYFLYVYLASIQSVCVLFIPSFCNVPVCWLPWQQLTCMDLELARVQEIMLRWLKKCKLFAKTEDAVCQNSSKNKFCIAKTPQVSRVLVSWTSLIFGQPHLKKQHTAILECICYLKLTSSVTNLYRYLFQHIIACAPPYLHQNWIYIPLSIFVDSIQGGLHRLQSWSAPEMHLG